MNLLPWSVLVLTAFGIIYGLLLHRAAIAGVYRITGWRPLDAYVLTWLLGLFAGYTPACLYLAFGFHEFAEPEGNALTRQLHRVARAEVAYFVLAAFFILAFVPQRSGDASAEVDLGEVIVWNVAFALVALLFLGIKGLWDRWRVLALC